MCERLNKWRKYKSCPTCGGRVPIRANYCPFCQYKFKSEPDTTDAMPEETVQKKKQKKLNKLSLSMTGILCIVCVCILFIDLILKVWVERREDCQKTDIIVNISDVELEVGEKTELLIDIKYPPLDYIVTYEDNPAVLEKWMDWEENDTRIPLTLTGLKETNENDKLYISIYDKEEYVKKESERKAIAEKFVSITVNPRSDITLKMDERIDLVEGVGETLMVTIDGDLPDDFYLSADVPESLELLWGEWENDNQCPITITGHNKLSDELVISLFDSTVINDGICLCSAKVNVVVE